MDNSTLLKELRKRLASGEISRSEIEETLFMPAAHGAAPETGSATPGRATKILYFIGAALVLLGLLYLGAELWVNLSPWLRVMITLGIGLVLAACGSLFFLLSTASGAGNAFHGIAGVFIPGGALVALSELAGSLSSPWWPVVVFSMLTVFYALLVAVHARAVLVFYALLNATLALYALLEAAMPFAEQVHHAWLSMAIGASYLILSQTTESDWLQPVRKLLIFAGASFVYIAAFSRLPDSRIMEFLFPVLAFAGLGASVSALPSRQILTLSTLAIIAYVIYLGTEYFANSLGWPVALILLGFVVIGLGTLSVRLHHRFLAQQTGK